MNQQIKDGFEVLVATRKKFLSLTDTLSLDQLNIIPKGFRNNIIWNIVHCLVSTDILTYKSCGMSVPLSKWVDAYRKDTFPNPQSPVNTDMLIEIKQQLIESCNRLMKDYQDNIFKEYKSYKTQFGVTLTSVEYGILYAINHEMFHRGYITALQKNLE